MAKKKVNLDDIEEGKEYQILTKPITLTEVGISFNYGVKVIMWGMA